MPPSGSNSAYKVERDIPSPAAIEAGVVSRCPRPASIDVIAIRRSVWRASPCCSKSVAPGGLQAPSASTNAASTAADDSCGVNRPADCSSAVMYCPSRRVAALLPSSTTPCRSRARNAIGNRSRGTIKVMREKSLSSLDVARPKSTKPISPGLSSTLRSS
jgi:hypothetical protein